MVPCTEIYCTIMYFIKIHCWFLFLSQLNNFLYFAYAFTKFACYYRIDKSKSMLACLQALPSVIAVAKTWLNDITSGQVNISGYNFQSSNRRIDKTSGGTGLYM